MPDQPIMSQHIITPATSQTGIKTVVCLTHFGKVRNFPSSEPITDERIIVDHFELEDSAWEDELSIRFFFLTKATENVYTIVNSKFLLNLQSKSTWKFLVPPMVYEYLKYIITKDLDRDPGVTLNLMERLESEGKIIVIPNGVAFSLQELSSDVKHFVIFLSTWGLIQQLLLISYVKPESHLGPWKEEHCQFIGDKMELPKIDFSVTSDFMWHKYTQFFTTLENIQKSLRNNDIAHGKVIFASRISDKLKHLYYLRRLHAATQFQVHVSPEFKEFVVNAIPEMEVAVTSDNCRNPECKFHYDCYKSEYGSHSLIRHSDYERWGSLLKMAEIRVGFLENKNSTRHFGIVFSLPDVI